MSVIILLIFFSMLVAGGFLAAFLWAVGSGQFDDQYIPSVRILFEDGKKNIPDPEHSGEETHRTPQRKIPEAREKENKN